MTPEEQQAQISQLVVGGQQVLDNWTVVLDMLDGMMAQTVARGWIEPQARALVVTMFINAMSQPPQQPQRLPPTEGTPPP